MPLPRRHLVNIQDTPYYHITSRCVRRAYLCGQDKDSGKSYEHRRHWLEQRIRLLSSIFTIDLCAYAVMTNHYHIVLKLSPNQSDAWSKHEVLDRWCLLFKGTLLVQNYCKGNQLSESEVATLEQTVEVYRDRLTNLSWFMKCLNEPIARMANREDKCKGHFWEARFTSQALLTDRALLASMVYVDLNPVRAGIAKTPEGSDFTSIKQRIRPSFGLGRAVRARLAMSGSSNFDVKEKPLAMFLDQATQTVQPSVSILPYNFYDYLQLVDTTGRLIRTDKRGVIDLKLPPILNRLSISLSTWKRYSTRFEHLHSRGEFRFARNKTT